MSRLPHVAVLAHSRHPIAQPFAGGLEALTWHLVSRLRQRGCRVTLFAGPGSDPALGAELMQVRPLTLSPAALADPSLPHDVDLIRQHHAYLQVMLQLQQREDIDIVHNNALHHLPPTMAGSLPAPMLTTLHTPPLPWLEPTVATQPDPRARYAAVSAATARAWQHVITAEVVPNGVDTQAWRPGPGGDALVWSGRLVPEKAPHLAALAARRAGVPLRIAGPVADEAYVDQVLRPALGDGVELVGHLAGPALRELVGSSSACLVTPAWDEPYGLVAAEALASGTPVLLIGRGGLPEVVDETCARIVPYRPGATDEELADALAALVPEVMRLPRAAARERAVTACSLDVMIDRYLRLYTDVIDGRAPSADPA